MRVSFHRSFALIAITAQFASVHTAAAENAADGAYAQRCMAAFQACHTGASYCAAYRDAFDAEGSVCPCVNAASNAPSTGPTQSRRQKPQGAPTAHGESDSLAEIQAGCDADHGYKTFGSQVKCIKSCMSLVNADSGDVQLYLLTADKLADDVARKQITVAAARVELQKAYLEFRDRTNRRRAEASSREDAARLAAQAQQAEVERRQAVADAE
jgi:hypothetical protein